MTIRQEVIELLVKHDLERIMNMNERQQREAISTLLKNDFERCTDEELGSMLDAEALDYDGE